MNAKMMVDINDIDVVFFRPLSSKVTAKELVQVDLLLL